MSHHTRFTWTRITLFIGFLLFLGGLIALERPLLHATAAQSFVILKLSLNNTLLGTQSEAPTTFSGVGFTNSGVINQGATLPPSSRLFYPSENNINELEGTIEAWVRPNWNGNNGQKNELFKFGAGGGILFGRDGNNLRILLNRSGENGNAEVDALANIADWQAGQWHYIAATWSNSQRFVRLYIDGTLISHRTFGASLPTLSKTANNTIQIGADGIRNHFDGTIDEFQISNIPRSSQEIAAQMLQGLTISGVNSNNFPTTIDLHTGWSYWKDLKINVTSTIGTLLLPAHALTWSSSGGNVAVIDSITGRIKGLTVGTTTLTASFGLFGELSPPIVVTVRTANLAATEETPAPNSFLATPATNSLYKIPVAIIRYFPTNDSTHLNAAVTGFTATLASVKNKQEQVERKLKFMLEEGSRFRGYKSPAVVPSLGYQVVKIVTIYEELPPGQPASGSERYYPDYQQILARVNAEQWVNNLGVKEIWLEQYNQGRIALHESNMASPTTDDVSVSARVNDDLPVYQKTYTLFGLNLAANELEAARSHNRHLEALLRYANQLQTTNDDLFVKQFMGPTDEAGTLAYRNGSTIRPPNAVNDFDFNNAGSVSSDIEDWTPDGTGVRAPVRNTNWTNQNYAWPDTPPAANSPERAEAHWYIYWRQAIAGKDNTIPYGDTDHVTNWWHFTGDWDAALKAKLGLYEPVSCDYILTSNNRIFQANGGSGSVSVTCEANCKWFASATEPWIKVTNAIGNGSGTISYTVDANPNSGTRTGKIIIAGKVFTVLQTNEVCTFQLSTTNQNFTANSANSTVNVTASNVNCVWAAASNANWITVISGGNNPGSGTVSFSVTVNTGPPRSGTITIAGLTFTVNQNSGCVFTPAPSAQTFTAGGGSGSINVNTGPNCPWTAVKNADWITFTGSNSGSGTASLGFTVAPSNGAARSGTITIEGQNIIINQAANTAPTMTASAAIARQQEAGPSSSIVATVNDAETAPGNLAVTALSLPTGMSLTSIINNNGTVSATIGASCFVTVGPNNVTLRVTDSHGATTTATLTVNITAGTNCFVTPAEAVASDQRGGSVLFYNLYTSRLSSQFENTQIRLTNTHDNREVTVRLFFIDSRTSEMLSLFACLQPNQTANFIASEIDPEVTGYVIAVAIDKTTGCPINFNHLMGGAYVKFASGHTANLGAIAVAALKESPVSCISGATSTALIFDGANYGRLPRMLVLDNIASVKDGNNILLILNRVSGSLLPNAGAIGKINGKLYDAGRGSQDFSFTGMTGQLRNPLSNTFPRMSPKPFDQMIPGGQSGWMKLWTEENVAFLGTAINLNPSLRGATSYVGGYNLQIAALAGSVNLTIPVTVPTCQ